MAKFIFLFNLEGQEVFWPFESRTKQEALEFLWRTTDQTPVALYREIKIAETNRETEEVLPGRSGPTRRGEED